MVKQTTFNYIKMTIFRNLHIFAVLLKKTMEAQKKTKRNLFAAALFLSLACLQPASATDLHFYRNDGKYNVYDHEKLDSLCFRNDSVKLNFKNGAEIKVYNEKIDSVILSDECKVAEMYIVTKSDSITRDEYTDCTVSIKGYGMFDDVDELTAQIRGRGNSTWLWYDKKPYRLKLAKKNKLLGLKKAKVFALLANYRDPTYLMNATVFEMGDYVGLDYNCNARFCEVYLNGEYNGLYMLTEQIKQGNNRVEVNDSTGILISLDVDDGPGESPDATDNFWNRSFTSKIPVCIKYPKDELLTDTRKEEVTNEFNALADLIAAHNYTEVKKIMDVQSFIDYLIIQDLVYNVELQAPRSMFLYRYTDKDTLWHMGPLWDFDGGFDFDWTDMYTSRKYFGENGSLLVTKTTSGSEWGWGGGGPGGRPGQQQGQTETINYNVATNESGVCPFFTQLFYEQEFVDDFKARWNEIKTNLLPQVFAKVENYYQQTYCAMERDEEKWGLTTSHEEQFQNLETWLKAQVELLDGYYNGIVTP